ncbi:MAG: DUF3810 domain-containing protein [Clostridia bacterium]|nr:DUF3810 domain-containing protein [Clostridia bacterium]
MTRLLRKINRWIPAPAMVVVLLGIIALGINIAYISSASFADFFNQHISQPLRTLNAHLTGWIPFSLAEFIILGSPVILAAVLSVSLRKAMRSTRYFVRTVAGLLAIALFLYVMFVFCFGAGYRTTTVDKKLGLERTKVSAEELSDTMNIVISHLNELADDVMFVQNKGSVRPWSHDKAVDLCVRSYAALADQHSFIPKLDVPVKQIVASELMTYTHISGVYTFFTGEANLNTNYPYFVNVYTTAHEMAHQRGIARENEANFLAYLVCITSDDPYMQYAGYLNMYEYLASPLYSASPSLYGKAVGRLDVRVRYDLECYSDFFDRYRDNIAADVSDAVNDTYLVLQGTEGSRSYGMVVDLAVAYHKNHP